MNITECVHYLLRSHGSDLRGRSRYTLTRGIHAVIVVIVVLLWPAASRPQSNPCGDLAFESFGPFDYRTISMDALSKVERNHFNHDVEQLIRGQTSSIGGDLAYTLRAVPNHPRALVAMAKLSRKERRATPSGAIYSVECWFERAVRFAPDDPAVRIVHGMELIRDGKNADAIIQLGIALQLAPDSANAHYNIGLAFFGVKDYERSLLHARQAYDLGFPLPGLRDKLRRAGAWKDK